MAIRAILTTVGTLRRKLRHDPLSKSFLSFTVSVIAIVVLPLTAIGLLFVNSMRESSEERLRASNDQLLSRVSTESETRISRLVAVGNLVHTDSALLDFESVPDSAQLQRMEGPYAERILPRLYDYLKLREQCFGKLNTLRVFDGAISAVYFADFRHDVLLSSGYGAQVLRSAADKAWMRDDLDQNSRGYRILRGGDADAYLVLDNRSFGRNSALVVKWDVNAFFTEEFHRVQPDPETRWAVYLGDEAIVSSKGGLPSGNPSAFGGETALSDGRWLVSRTAFRPMDAQLVLLAPARLAYRSYAKYLLVLGATFLAFLAVSIALAFLSIGRLSRPVRETIRETLPGYEHMLVWSAITGRTRDLRTFRQGLERLQIPLEEENLAVIVLGFSQPSGGRGDEEIQQAGTSVILERWRGLALAGERDELIVLASVPRGSDGELRAAAAETIAKLRLSPGVECGIGLARSAQGLADLADAYGAAREAMEYSRASPSAKVNFIDDIRLEGERCVRYPERLDRLIRNLSSAGNTGEARHALRRFAEELEVPGSDPDLPAVRFGLIRFLASFCGNDAAFKTVPEISSRLDGLLRIILERPVEESLKELGDFIEEAAGHREHFGKKGPRYIDTLTALLQEDCGVTVSLESVAGKLGLHPSYLSRLVKEKTGKTFTDYLTQVRLDKSLTLLRTTKEPLASIAVRIGYSNANYFIKVFKEQFGCTPGNARGVTNNERSALSDGSQARE